MTPPLPDAGLRRDALQALYVQLAALLERDIAGGTYAPADKLPSEQALMARFGVSRITVRQAIGLLVRKRLIEVKQGKGTFVASPVVRHGLDKLTGFYDSLVLQGLAPRTKLLEFGVATAADRAATTFADGGDPAVALRRLYSLNGRPFAVVDGLLAAGAGDLTRAQVETHTIYRLLRDVLGEEVIRAEIGIRARRVGSVVGRLLKLAPGRPVLIMQRISLGRSGKPIEHSFFHIVPETYEFRLNVSGPLQITSSLQAFGARRSPEATPDLPAHA
ncbi:MAG: GntR family transcriptional regulator [Casimicrobiaceae bacterium]